MKKDLLIQIDGKMPNLALRKFGGFLKEKDHRVFYDKECSEPDHVYISCIFQKNAPRARGIARRFTCPTEVGGYGVNGVQLPDEIEHHMPDYKGMDFSFGYSTRGCNRNCPWCIIPEKEGYIRDHAPISEFHYPDHNKLILFDNNLLALKPKFKEDMNYIEENNLKVCFCQGLDIRLVDEKTAGMLAGCRYYSLRFKERRLYFAFDTMGVEHAVKRGVKILKEAGIRSRHLMFYMLCGFQEPYDFARDWHRFKILLELGVDPYVMKYNGRRDIRILNHFSRWVIKRDCKRKRPKYLRPHEWEELQEAISQAEMEIERRKW